MRKSIALGVGVITLSLFLSGFCPGVASAVEPKESGDMAAGVLWGWGWGGGPYVAYHVSEQVAVRGAVSALGSFTGYQVNGVYHFMPFLMGDIPGSLFGSAGYTVLDGPEWSYGSTSWETEGSGVLVSAGSQFNITDSMSASAEFAFSAVTMEVVSEGSYSGTFESDFSSMSLVLSVGYYF